MGFLFIAFFITPNVKHIMTQQLLKSRLLESAQCAPEQMQPDFETQFEEFKAIVHSVLYSESGYLAIAQSRAAALGLLPARLPR